MDLSFWRRWRNVTNLHANFCLFQDWKEDVILGFIQFLVKEIPDTQPQLVDNALRMLMQLLAQWKTAASNTSASASGSSTNAASANKDHQDDTPSHKLLADR